MTPEDRELSALTKLSILIVSWNGRSHLELCLPALERCVKLLEQRPEGACEAEVWVLDNGSTDGTLEWLGREHPRVRTMSSALNLGFAAGNNRLAEAADGDLLLLINNDTLPEPDLLLAFVDAWRAAPSDVAALAGRMTDWEARRIDFGRGVATFDGHAFALDQGRALERARLPRSGDELLFGCGGNLLVRRSSFLEAGGFDESYFAYFEDVDLGWRLWSGGERVLACPQASVRHRQSATGVRLGDERRGAMFERNALLTVAKNLGPGMREKLLPVILLTFLARIRAMADPIPEEFPGGIRSSVARGLRALADRLASPAPAGTRLPHPQAAAQIAGLGGFLTALEGVEGERARLELRRRRDDREILERFPLWIVPTYPGDERLFASRAFSEWLPSDLPFERSTLEQVIARP